MIARLMTIGRERLSKAKTIAIAAIESGVELLLEAHEIVADFQAMIRRKALEELDSRIERAKTSRVAPTAKPKARFASSRSSSARCMGEENLICCKRTSSALHDPIVIKSASDPVCWTPIGGSNTEPKHSRVQWYPISALTFPRNTQ
jgi:hypothetical protein